MTVPRNRQNTKQTNGQPTTFFTKQQCNTAYETEFEPTAITTELEVTHTHIKNLAALPGWSHHIPMLTTTPRPRDRIFI